jgi:hypothetical protein
MVKHHNSLLARITNAEILKKLRKLTGKIVKEHFEMTLVSDKPTNYLWWSYMNGAKAGTISDFILICEINLLLSLGLVTEEQRDTLGSMFSSEDQDNIYMALLSIEQLRESRIKTHGEYDSKEPNVSPELMNVILRYPVHIIKKFVKK